ncbi:signal recognition particle-docking protein FtsY [Gottschalkiaceae bacterium SANA]|nr:signal recognition particle-docking protein FtsY [Gottschalkiaceae bacterium SANA]
MEKKNGFFKKLFGGLEKTRQQLTNRISALVSGHSELDEEFYEELEEILILSDMSFDTVEALVQEVKKRAKKMGATESKLAESLIREILIDWLTNHPNEAKPKSKPHILLVVGVNGAGKTTTCGKIAALEKRKGQQVMLAAADTFRAAAVEQLMVWGERAQVPVISQGQGADPAAVVFDAVQAAKSRNIDLLICDTAGRLHNKKNLMLELEKIHRVLKREAADASIEVLLVLDATTGQNAVHQAKTFHAITPLDGIILTKLDGSSKGGVIVPIVQELQIPIQFIGVGEGLDDLQEFNAEKFVDALFPETVDKA